MAKVVGLPENIAHKWNLENLMQQDPFFQSGMIDLANVKSFEKDPKFETGFGIDQPAVTQAKADMYGYTYPGKPELYVGSADKPVWETAATTTHEGIHQVMPQELIDAIGKDAGSALGVTSGDNTYASVGADYARNELMTRWLENQIWGDEIAPFDESAGKVNPFGLPFNYITMDRPGQGALGRKGIMELLAKRGMPFLKKIALQAHKNIERKYKPSKKTYVAPPRGGGADVMPTPPKKTYVSPARHAFHIQIAVANKEVGPGMVLQIQERVVLQVGI